MRRTLLALLPFLTIACASAKMATRDVIAVAKGPSVQHAAIAAAATGAALLLDDEIATRLGRRASRPPIVTHIETLGGGNADKVIAGFLLYGLARNDARAKATAFDAIISSVIASKAITPALQQLTDRRRPNGGGDSFPSNHTTNAFAVASAISAHYPRVRWLAYGLATGVGAARIVHDAHWTSDVIAGAAIGTFVGHTVAKTNQRSWRITPTRHGVVVSVSW